MRAYMLEELRKIAQVKDLQAFRALDKLADSMSGYGGQNAAGAQMTPPPSTPQSVGSPGATNMAGMSIHCDRCNAEIKEVEPRFCPRCGNRIKAVRDIKRPPQETRTESSSGGVEAAGDDASESGELSESNPEGMGKYSAESSIKALLKSPAARKIKGGLAVGGGLFGASKIAPLLAAPAEGPTRPQYVQKHAGRRGSRLSALHFKPKGGKGTYGDGMLRIQKATAKATKRVMDRI